MKTVLKKLPAERFAKTAANLLLIIMRPSYSTIALMAAILGTFVGFACSQMSPVYNPILFNVKSFRSLYDKPANRFIPKEAFNQKEPKYAAILKKSDASWEDLGWAWGKRSVGLEAAAPSEEANLSRASRSLKQVKKNPDWHDLGWAWGRK
uniref:ABC transporter permease n=1 Tax=Panagrellus redivivus TaxID=6233 RepID=A0A7E4VRE7_PANRE